MELHLWNASDFTGSGSDKTRNAGATPLASHTARLDDKPQRAELHVDLQPGDYVVEAVNANPGEDGAFTLGTTPATIPSSWAPNASAPRTKPRRGTSSSTWTPSLT